MAFLGNPTCISGQSEIRSGPEYTGSTFLKGELIYLSTGSVRVCATGATKIAGRALEDATGSTANIISYEVIAPEQQWEMVCSATLAVTDIGVNHGITNSGNKTTVNLSDESNDAVTIDRAKFTPLGAYGTTAVVKFLPTVCQHTTGA